VITPHNYIYTYSLGDVTEHVARFTRASHGLLSVLQRDNVGSILDRCGRVAVYWGQGNSLTCENCDCSAESYEAGVQCPVRLLRGINPSYFKLNICLRPDHAHRPWSYRKHQSLVSSFWMSFLWPRSRTGRLLQSVKTLCLCLTN
jgi:hypothetical protein